MKTAAKLIRENKIEIIATWEGKVRKDVKASSATSSIALHDHLPQILEDISDIFDRLEEIENPYQDEKYFGIVENSLHHGRHRAATSKYTVDQVIYEYIIFHRVLTELFIKNHLYKPQIIEVLKYSIENAILKSVTAFSDSLNEMQEKLMGTLAHDIRNPLTSVYIALEMMEYEDKTSFQEMKDISMRGLKRSLQLVEDLLDTITVKAGEGMMFSFSECDLVEQIKSLCDEFSEIHTNRVHFEASDEQIMGEYDPTALRRGVENLLTNAIKYGSQKDLITITLDESTDHVKISVHNHGSPIPKEMQENIFNFLKRSKAQSANDEKSWGIGLTMVKMVAEAHGGGVELISGEGDGTTFIINLKRGFNQSGKSRTRINFEN